MYQFDIELISEDPAVDMNEVVQNPARFTILREEGDIPFYGIPISFEQMHEVDGMFFYRVVLAPRLWWLSQTYHNQVFLDKRVPEILETVLKDGGLTENDFELRLEAEYRNWDYVCQYRESHLDFASRWMEREGMYYFFEQDGAREKLIITDSNLSHLPMPQGKIMYYSPPSALDSLAREEVIKDFCCRQNTLPSSVRLKDYNYEKPSLAIEGLADVYEEGRGEVYMYGEHFLTAEEGNRLANIRAQEINCWQRTYHGESTVPFLRPGFLLELSDHFRKDFNRDYLSVEVNHQGSQAAYMLAGLSTELAEAEKQPYYVNRLTALPAAVQFRPQRKTSKARFYGTMHARIDAAGSGKYAEIDEQGRYKVILPFDRSGRFGGKASAWIRMMQPYAGPNQGMHFPLHKGTEVLLTFIDGDPDRPIIAGAVPNPETTSPVNSLNQTKSVIKTGRSPEDGSAGAGDARARSSSHANNYIAFNDADNNENIVIQSQDFDDSGDVDWISWSRHGKNANDPDDADSGTRHTDNQPEQEKTPNTTGLKFFTDHKVSFQANDGQENRIVGRSIEIARDEYRFIDPETNKAVSMNEWLLTTMENFAPANVFGYDELATLPESNDEPPGGFPECYEAQPVPEPTDSFLDFFDKAFRIETQEGMRDALESTAQWIEDAGKDTGDWVKGAGQDSGEWIENAGKDTGDWVEDGGYGSGDWVEGAGEDVGEWVQGAGEDAGEWIDNAAQDTADFAREEGEKFIHALEKKYLKDEYNGKAADAWKELWQYWVGTNTYDGFTPRTNDNLTYNQSGTTDLPAFLDNVDYYHDDDEAYDLDGLREEWNEALADKWDIWREERITAWKQWQPHLKLGRTTVSHRDTFNIQEGNIYDFGGYWNYNLGNSYEENHMNQHATVNDPDLPFDRASHPGPPNDRGQEKFKIACEDISPDGVTKVHSGISMPDYDNTVNYAEDMVEVGKSIKEAGEKIGDSVYQTGQSAYDAMESLFDGEVDTKSPDEFKGWTGKGMDGNTWVAKTIGGAAYEYTKDTKTLSVEYKTAEEEHIYSKAAYEYKYTVREDGQAILVSKTKSQGGSNEEWKYDRVNSTLLAHEKTDWLGGGGNIISSSFTMGNKISSSISITGSQSLSLGLGLDLNLPIKMGGEIEIKTLLTLSLAMQMGATVALDFDARLVKIKAEPSLESVLETLGIKAKVKPPLEARQDVLEAKIKALECKL